VQGWFLMAARLRAMLPWLAVSAAQLSADRLRRRAHSNKCMPIDVKQPADVFARAAQLAERSSRTDASPRPLCWGIPHDAADRLITMPSPVFCTGSLAWVGDPWGQSGSPLNTANERWTPTGRRS